MEKVRRMRTIKFRAWDLNDEEMLYDCTEKVTDCYIYSQNHACKLMQFTGLKDKNGKEIYEGDIIGNRTNVWEIGFRNGRFGAIHPEHSKAYLCDFDNSYITTYCEVKGNIYKNPELLE